MRWACGGPEGGADVGHEEGSLLLPLNWWEDQNDRTSNRADRQPAATVDTAPTDRRGPRLRALPYRGRASRPRPRPVRARSNALDDSNVDGDDWDTLYAGGANTGGNSDDFTDVVSDIAAPGDQFQGGGSKDNNDLNQWLWKEGEPLDKDDITNTYVAGYGTRDRRRHPGEAT